MITTLHIKNIGIIDEININLNEGFNVLTGETGAGKTLIIGSLQILSGGRFSKEMIRKGENNSFVEMSMFLPGKGYEDDTVVVSREININGKNLCKINGRLVSVGELKKFMSKVLDIHGQNDNQSILDVSTHIDLVDKYAEKEIRKHKDEYLAYYEEYLKIKEELKSNYGDDKEKERKLDLLRYQLNEIEEASLKEGEEDELLEERKIIAASEKITNNLYEAQKSLNESAIESMEHAIRALEKIEEYSDKFKCIVERLRSSYYEVEECARDVENEADRNTFDEERLSEIENRLECIKTLKRKYGNTVKEILEYKSKVKKEIYDIENLEEYILKLKKDLKVLEEKMFIICEKIHNIRVKNAKKISEEINVDLKELEMKNARFSIQVELNENKEFNKNGLDNVEFLISTNIGEESKPLVKIASGGELSRVMLALKTIFAKSDSVGTLIFDEIDTGIGGEIAVSVGNHIKKLALQRQIFCITHLASIAVYADNQIKIEKSVSGGVTASNVHVVVGEERVQEIARMLSGDSSSSESMEHARTMLNKFGGGL